MTQHSHPAPLTRRRFLGRTAVASGTLLVGGGLLGARINPASAQQEAFDYVIVGAGSAGCVLAHRLTEDPDVRVALIEAGGPDTSEMISTPIRLIELWNTEYDWAYNTVPQEHCAGRQIFWPRGKVLGGSSSLNGMIYVRGDRSDYDAWAYAGNEGWDYDSILPYFKKSEDYELGENQYHGAGGPMHVTQTFTPHPVTRAMVEASVAWGLEFNADCNGASPLGAGYTQLTTKDGKRHSTAVAFLRPALERPNLTLITNARVHHVRLEGGRATGVVYRQEGDERTVTAGREVILSGGTLESPRVLMLSGIGPGDHLRQMGLPVVQDLPGVGQNLHDHTLCPLTYAAAAPIPAPADPSIQVLHGQAFLKSDAARLGPDLQPLYFHVPYYAPGQSGPEMGFSLNAGGVRPTSRGFLRLTGADPDDPLHIDPHLLETEYDVRMLVQSFRWLREIAAQAPLDPWRGAELYPGPDATSDQALADYARSAVLSYHHQVGTCAMGRDDRAVVDPALRVHGITGLRVVDASIMPAVVSGNTNAPTIMIAEKAADMIRDAARQAG